MPLTPAGPTRRWSDWLSVAECVLALSLVLVLLTPLVLLLPQVEGMRLVAVPLAGAPELDAAAEEVRGALAGLELAESVDVAPGGDGLRLTFRGVDSLAFSSFAIDDVLRERGFRIERRTSFVEPDLDALMRNERLIVATLLVQGAALLLVGGGLSLFRLGAWPLRRGGVARALATGSGLGLVALVGSLAIAQIQTWLGFEVREQEAIVEMLRGLDLWKLVPFFVILAPISEEVFFRGYVLRYVGSRLGPALGYGVSAVLFAAIHLNPSGFLAYLTVGLVFAYAYRRTRNLLAPIAAHMVYNGCAMAAAFLTRIPPS